MLRQACLTVVALALPTLAARSHMEERPFPIEGLPMAPDFSAQPHLPHIHYGPEDADFASPKNLRHSGPVFAQEQKVGAFAFLESEASAHPILALAMVFAVLFVAGAHFHKGTTPERGFMFNMESLYMLTYIAFVPESLQLAEALGGDAHFSGWLIAAPVPGDAILSVVLWALFRTDAPSKVMRWAKFSAMGAAAVMFVATASTAVLMYAHEKNAVGPAAVWLVLLFRFILGFGSTNFICQQVFTIFARPEERPALNVQLFVSCMVGLGCGPILSGAAHWLLDGSMPFFTVVPVVLATLQGSCLLAMAVLFPSMKEKAVSADATGGEAAEISTPEEGHAWRVGTFLAFTALRGFGVSSLESGTAMILEEEMGWSLHMFGLVIGVTFMAVVPFKILFDFLRARRTSLCTILRSFMALAICSAFLWFTHTCAAAGGAPIPGMECWRLLLIGDAFFFPTMFLCSGITRGLMMNEVRPTGFFKRENVILLDLIFNTVGRSLGPPVARILMDWGNRNLYAVAQVSAVSLAWLLADRAVASGERYCSKEA